MERTVALLPGDGIGPEIMAAALRVLRAVEERFGHRFRFVEGKIGGAAYDAFGTHFPEETRTLCRSADAILFGAVGGPVAHALEPKWNRCEVNSILALRREFSFAVNYRPVILSPELASLSCLRKDLLEKGIDLVVVRELTGDIYFGEHQTGIVNGRRVARDVAEYGEEQIASVAHAAFRLAAARRGNLVSIDKANVLDTSKLWRAVVTEVAAEYPAVTLEHMLVDNCAMQLVRDPVRFDVILTSNLFGDILSDEAAALVGSLGLLGSASLNSEGFGLYEPPGGSAPDIAGRGIANPVGQIRAAAMMLELSFGLVEEARAVEMGICSAFCAGARTLDLGARNGEHLSTAEMGEQIAQIVRGSRFAKERARPQ